MSNYNNVISFPALLAANSPNHTLYGSPKKRKVDNSHMLMIQQFKNAVLRTGLRKNLEFSGSNLSKSKSVSPLREASISAPPRISRASSSLPRPARMIRWVRIIPNCILLLDGRTTRARDSPTRSDDWRWSYWFDPVRWQTFTVQNFQNFPPKMYFCRITETNHSDQIWVPESDCLTSPVLLSRVHHSMDVKFLVSKPTQKKRNCIDWTQIFVGG